MLLERLLLGVGLASRILELLLKLLYPLFELLTLPALVLQVLLKLTLSALQLRFKTSYLNFESLRSLLFLRQLVLQPLNGVFRISQFLLQVGHTVLQITCCQTVLLNYRVESINLSLESLDLVISFSDHVLAIGDDPLLVNDLFVKGLALQIFVS